MKTKLFTALFLLSLFLQGQENSVFEKLHSTHLDSALFIDYDGKNFNYKKSYTDDGSKRYPIANDSTKLFQVSNDDDNTLKLFLAFYNPLRHTITVSASEIEDSNYEALSSFISNLPKDIAFVNSVTSDAAPAAFVSKDVKGYTKTNTAEQAVIDKRVKEINTLLNALPNASVLLFDWIKEFKSLVSVDKLVDDFYFEAFKEQMEIIGGVSDVENYILKDISIRIEDTPVNKKVLNWVSYAHEGLYGSDGRGKLGLEGFEKVMAESTVIEKELVAKKEQAETQLKALKSMLEDDTLLLERFFDSKMKEKDLNEFRALSQMKLVMIDALISDKLSKNNQGLETLGKLNKKLKEFIKNFKGDIEGYKSIGNTSFKWKNEKGKQYDIKAVALSQDGTEKIGDTTHSIKLKIWKSQGRLAIFASAGLFYTPFEYKNYGLSDGTVAETQGDPVYFRPAVYLNFMWRPRHGDILYPMFQIGVTQGIKTPLFPVGLGLSLRNKFSITAGPLIAFQNELNKLHIGDIADDAALKDDLQSHIKFSWYLSLNYKL